MAANSAQMPTQEVSTVANVDVVSLQVSLPQMLDLALGTPEVGAVNFNILHNFLHVLLHQINLQTTKVEYRGENADRIKTMVTSLKPEPALRLQEYSITDNTGKVSQRIKKADGISVDVLAEDTQLDDLKVTKGVMQQVGPEKDSAAQKVIFVEPVVDGSTPTGLAFKQLEQSVKQLQQQFQALEDLAKTPEVIERIKGRITDPIADVWQFININKRLDASEQGIEKITTMVQDMIRGDTSVAVTADTSMFSAKLDELESKVSEMEKMLTDLQEIVSVLIEGTPPTAGIDIKKNDVPPAETDEVVPSREIPKTAVDKLAARRMLVDENGMAEIRRDVTTLKTDVAQVQQQLRDLTEKFTQIKAPTEITAVGAVLVRESPTDATEDKQKVIEISNTINMKQCLESVKNLETRFEDTLHDIAQRVDTLEKEVGQLIEKMESLPVANSEHDINELVTKVKDIQTDMERLGQTADKLLDDKESREAQLNTLLEQVELLKTIKADKEDLEDALADKADAQAVNRKVSHDQFDAACDDLTRGLEEAVDKLNMQESIWQQVLDEVQNEIASKVDKIEMTPLKDFVNNRLKSLQEKLKSIAEMRRECEAAGTKKLLRDVQCISCDKEVVMRTEEIGGLRADPLPCTSSMKPYLTYELDQVRKQQRRLPHSRNMIQFEAAVQEESRKIKITKEETLAKTPRDHLCNRYCGGSHTITTPQQRVMRVGHYLAQWGPETRQLTDGLIRGKDGQMYRSRPMPGKLDICGPVCWESQISEETRTLLSQERAQPVPGTPRKSLQSRRNSTGSRINERRTSKKQLKELKVTEPPMKPIVEMQQVALPQEINKRALNTPTEPQDEIILYDTNEAVEEE